MMIPLDMRGVGKDHASVEDMVDKLGAVGAAEAFLKAREYFEANHDKEPEEERPKPMTAREWKLLMLEGEEEEDLFEDEEEDFLEDGEEELDLRLTRLKSPQEEWSDEEDEEPPAKQAKVG